MLNAILGNISLRIAAFVQKDQQSTHLSVMPSWRFDHRLYRAMISGSSSGNVACAVLPLLRKRLAIQSCTFELPPTDQSSEFSLAKYFDFWQRTIRCTLKTCSPTWISESLKAPVSRKLTRCQNAKVTNDFCPYLKIPESPHSLDSISDKAIVFESMFWKSTDEIDQFCVRSFWGKELGR